MDIGYGPRMPDMVLGYQTTTALASVWHVAPYMYERPQRETPTPRVQSPQRSTPSQAFLKVGQGRVLTARGAHAVRAGGDAVGRGPASARHRNGRAQLVILDLAIRQPLSSKQHRS